MPPSPTKFQSHMQRRTESTKEQTETSKIDESIRDYETVNETNNKCSFDKGAQISEEYFGWVYFAKFLDRVFLIIHTVMFFLVFTL